MAHHSRPKAPLVEFRDVVKRFGENTVLDGVNFSVDEGETLCVVGGSGTGKSVTLKLVLGVETFDEGEILWRELPLSQMTDSELNDMRHHIGMCFQGGALFDSLTVFENVAYPLEEKGIADPDEIEKRVMERLEWVGLKDAADKLPGDLSGGMIKRVAMARAIITEPELILYDEPTAGLDPTNVNRIDELILDLKKRLKVASIVVTHHMESVFRIADKVALLWHKKIAFMGSVEAFKASREPVVQDFIAGRIGD